MAAKPKPAAPPPARKKPGEMPPEKVFKIYELARAGVSRSNMIQILHTTPATFDRWVRAYPPVATALELGHRRAAPDRDAENAFEHLYGHMDAGVRKVWDKVHQMYETDAPTEDVEAELSANPRHVRQQIFLHALVKYDYDKSAACRVARISRHTLNAWKRSPHFRQCLEEIRWHKKNFYEGGLVRLVKEGDSAATVFANKTLNRDRGYGERIDHTHEVSVRRQGVGLERLLDYLDDATKLKILDAVRRMNAPGGEYDTGPPPPALPPAAGEEVSDADFAEVES